MTEPRPDGPLLELRGVNKVYPLAATHALRDVDLTIHAGEKVAIVGPSGSGKSTLLNLLGALNLPTAGTILFRGRPLDPREADAYRAREVGFVFQAFHLLPNLTAGENVQIPLLCRGGASTARRERATRVLEAVGLGGRVGHRPNQLSGGERQRVAIARALVNEPSLILADEPTGNLDTRTGDEVLRLFDDARAARRVTFLMVTHNDTIAARCDRVIRLLDGRVIEDYQPGGTPSRA